MCHVCNGLPGCPVCSEEIPTQKCTECDNGKIYITDDDGEVPYLVWILTPADLRDVEDCEVCDGEGRIPIEDPNI